MGGHAELARAHLLRHVRLSRGRDRAHRRRHAHESQQRRDLLLRAGPQRLGESLRLEPAGHGVHQQPLRDAQLLLLGLQHPGIPAARAAAAYRHAASDSHGERHGDAGDLHRARAYRAGQQLRPRSLPVQLIVRLGKVVLDEAQGGVRERSQHRRARGGHHPARPVARAAVECRRGRCLLAASIRARNVQWGECGARRVRLVGLRGLHGRRAGVTDEAPRQCGAHRGRQHRVSDEHQHLGVLVRLVLCERLRAHGRPARVRHAHGWRFVPLSGGPVYRRDAAAAVRREQSAPRDRAHRRHLHPHHGRQPARLRK